MPTAKRRRRCDVDEPNMTERSSVEQGSTNGKDQLTSTMEPMLGERVALLTHALSPHRLALAERVAAEVAVFRVFVSQREDQLHKFPLERGSLVVTLQRSLNWRHTFHNVHGYEDVSHIHLPFDTLVHMFMFKPSMILSTELGARSFLAVLYKLCLPHTRLILWATLSERTEATRGAIRKRLRQWLLARVDAVFVNGKEGGCYIRTLGYEGMLCTIPYAIDATLFLTKTFAPQQNRFRLLYTGQLIPRKGLVKFCLTLSQWLQENPGLDVTFTLVGEGKERDRLVKLKDSMSFSMSIHPRASQSELLRFYEEADISVLPTLGDEWGMVVNESLNAARPVLGSVHSQAVTELIQDGENGWIWDPEEEGSLYRTLSRVFQTGPQELRSMSEFAKHSVAKVSPDLVSSKVLAALQAVAARRDR